MTIASDEIVFVSSFDDLAQLGHLYAAAQLGQRSPAEIAEAFRNSRYKVFALHHGRLVGAGRAFGDEIDCVVICDMAVIPDFQGRGIGDRILDTLKEMVRHHLRIILYAKPGKEAFYGKRGFNPMKTAMLCSFRVAAADNRKNGLTA